MPIHWLLSVVAYGLRWKSWVVVTEISWPHEPKMFTIQTKFDNPWPQFHEGKNCVHLIHLYFQCPNSAWSKLSNPSINVGFPLFLLPTGPHGRHLLVVLSPIRAWILTSCLQTTGSCHLPPPPSPTSLLCISNVGYWKAIWSQWIIPHHKASSGLWPS